MLKVVDGFHVVAVFMIFDRAVQSRPGPRRICGMNLVTLDLPGIDARERSIVVAELEIARDPQVVDRPGCQPH